MSVMMSSTYDSGRVAELAVAERLGVDAVHDGFSGTGRAAGGQDEDLIEDLESR